MKVNYDKSTVYRLGSANRTNAKVYSMGKLKWSDKINVLGINISKEEELIKENFDPLITRAENVMNTWALRGLSLMGKITIINTLVASLFVYRLAVIPKLLYENIKSYNNIIKNLIWDGKCSKVALEILQGLKEDGGVNLADIEAKDKALKLQWVFTINRNLALKTLAYDLLNNPIHDYIWEINMNQRDAEKIFIKQGFWPDVFKLWASTTYGEPKASDEVQGQIIWWNSFIRIEGEPIFWEKWFQAGVIKIQDLLDEDEKFLSARDLQSKVGINISFIALQGIITAIPQSWKRLINQNINSGKECSYQSLKVNQGSNVRILYTNIKKNRTLLGDLAQRWSNAMGCEIQQEELKNAIRNVMKITIYGKLRSFQVRLIYRGIITNLHLYYFKITSSKLCTFCDTETETVLHLFWECTHTQAFISNLRTKLGLQIQNCKNYLLNREYANPKFVQNFIVLAAKHYIYVKRCNKERLIYKHFIQNLKMYEQIEERIAIENGKYAIHELKWKEIKTTIN